MKTHILIVDDHPIVRHGMAQLINQNANMQICCEAGNHIEALVAMRECRHDLVIVDISLDNHSGLTLTKALLARYPKLPILVMSMHDESIYAERAIRQGAKGYIMKSQAIAHIHDAINTIMAGGIYLSETMQDILGNPGNPSAKPNEKLSIAEFTNRELEILHLMGQGLSTKAIAQAMKRSIKTVETHRDNLRHKLKLKTGTDLVRYASLWLSEQRGQPHIASDKSTGASLRQANGSPTIRIALVEDNPRFQQDLTEAIRSVADMTLIGIAGTRAQGLQLLAQDPADVVLVELGLPDGCGTDIIRAVRLRWPDCRVLVNSVFADDWRIVQSLEAGASGYLLKHDEPEKVIDRIRQLHGGEKPISPSIAKRILQRFESNDQTPGAAQQLTNQPVTLSPREQQVLALLSKGFAFDEIAATLMVSHATVISAMRRVYGKLVVASKYS
jgi:DNA-binding NarL/FixJ family response regulator